MARYNRHGLYDLTTQTLTYRVGGSPVQLADVGVSPLAIAEAALTRTDVHDIWLRGVPSEWWRDWPADSHPWETFRQTQQGGRTRTASATRTGWGTVYFHEWGTAPWPGVTHPDPLAVLPVYDALSDALARPFGFSPAALGLDILKTTFHRRPEWFRPETPTLALRHPRQTFVRLPRDDDGPYVHAFDMKAAFFAVARSLRFPTGAAMHLADPRLMFGPVGLATAEHAALVNLTANRRAPGPITKEGWHAQSVYRAALAWGQHPVTRDAYVYAQRHEAMREWAETLLTALKLVSRSGGCGADQQRVRIAVAVWKTIYIETIGRLAWQPPSGPKWYTLPLWHAMIEGEAMRRMWGAVGTAERPLALALSTDEILVPSHSPDPADALGTLGEAPGNFVHKWSAEGYPPAALEAARRGDAVACRDALRGES